MSVSVEDVEDQTMYEVPNKSSKRCLLAAVAGLGLLVMAGETRAGDWSLHIGAGHRYRPVREGHVRAVRTAPVYEYRPRRIWVAPQYTERTVRVEVPAVVEERVVPIHDAYGRITGYRTVREIVEEARIEYRTERIVVREGYFKTVTVRVLIRPAGRRVTQDIVYRDHGGSGLHVGFTYRKHKEHKHRPRRVLHRLLRALHRH